MGWEQRGTSWRTRGFLLILFCLKSYILLHPKAGDIRDVCDTWPGAALASQEASALLLV